MASLIEINEKNIIQSCKIAFGGLAATTIRVKEIENALIGKSPVSSQNDVVNITKKTIKPLSDLRGSADYRINLAIGLLKRLLFSVSNDQTYTEVMNVGKNE